MQLWVENLAVWICALPMIWETVQLKPSEPITFCVLHVTIVLMDINPLLLPNVLTSFDVTCTE